MVTSPQLGIGTTAGLDFKNDHIRKAHGGTRPVQSKNNLWNQLQPRQQQQRQQLGCPQGNRAVLFNFISFLFQQHAGQRD